MADPCATARLALRPEAVGFGQGAIKCPIVGSHDILLPGRLPRALVCPIRLCLPFEIVPGKAGSGQESSHVRRLCSGGGSVQGSQRGQARGSVLVRGLGGNWGTLDEDDDEWESDMMDEMVDFRAGIGRRARKSSAQETSKVENPASDWAEKARQQALKSLELRLGRPVELPSLEKRKKKKKAPKNKKSVVEEEVIFELGSSEYSSERKLDRFRKQLSGEERHSDTRPSTSKPKASARQAPDNVNAEIDRKLGVGMQFESQQLSWSARADESEFEVIDDGGGEDELIARVSSQAGFRNRLGDLAGLARYFPQQEQVASSSEVERVTDSVGSAEAKAEGVDRNLEKDQRLSHAKALVEQSVGKWKARVDGNLADSNLDDSNLDSGPAKGQRGDVQVPGLRSRETRGEAAPNMADLELNKRIVSADGLEAVLQVVQEAMAKARIGQELSIINAVTALHRVAKHMEGSGGGSPMAESQRLAVARRRDMAMLVGLVMESLPHYGPQGLSNTAWALSKIGKRAMYHAEFDRVARVSLDKVALFGAQHVANCAGSFAAAHHAAHPLFDALDAQADSLARRTHPAHLPFSLQEVSQLLWAHAFVDRPAPLLLDALDDSISFILSQDTTPPHVAVRQLSAMAWAYAVAQQLTRPAFSSILQHIHNLTHNLSGPQDARLGLDNQHLLQLHQVELSLEMEAEAEAGLRLREDLRELACIAWEMEKASAKRTSTYQREVRDVLRSGLGMSWVEELRDERSPYSLDLALPQHRIAIEVDGPSHFLRNTMAPSGPTQLKRRHLAASQWTLISVPCFEWDQLSGEQNQREYLWHKLKRHVEAVASTSPSHGGGAALP